LKPELRNAWLLAASLLFYAWGEVIFAFFMIGSILINHLSAQLIEMSWRWGNKSAGKWILSFNVAVNIGLLVFYKYANFIVENLNNVLASVSFSPISLSHVDLPIGISFFTFQAMSYVIDVYRKESEVQHNPLNTGLYVSLFPQLIAGPIVRYVDVAAQINKRDVNLEKFAKGIERFIIGLGKKVLIANTVASVADQIFAIPQGQLTAGLSWLGILCYSIQIYFDFSGYSDMAIGLGWMFGFHFLENFNYPYISKSIQEFWRRWHISLSTWFRDYLYIPLGGSKGTPARTYFNLIIVFFLCGLWHGAAWNFLAWGLYHGLFLVLERQRFWEWQKKLRAPFQHAYVLIVVIFGWVLFRAESLDYAVAFSKAMMGFGSGSGIEFFPAMYFTNELLLVLVLGTIGSAPLVPQLKEMYERWQTLPRQTGYPFLARIVSPLKFGFLIFVFIASAMSLASGTYNPFIYYRF
jgi:alginate O-acetyltransferase complex protein AlgI